MHRLVCVRVWILNGTRTCSWPSPSHTLHTLQPVYSPTLSYSLWSPYTSILQTPHSAYLCPNFLQVMPFLLSLPCEWTVLLPRRLCPAYQMWQFQQHTRAALIGWYMHPHAQHRHVALYVCSTLAHTYTWARTDVHIRTSTFPSTKVITFHYLICISLPQFDCHTPFLSQTATHQRTTLLPDCHPACRVADTAPGHTNARQTPTCNSNECQKLTLCSMCHYGMICSVSTMHMYVRTYVCLCDSVSGVNDACTTCGSVNFTKCVD